MSPRTGSSCLPVLNSWKRHRDAVVILFDAGAMVIGRDIFRANLLAGGRKENHVQLSSMDPQPGYW